MKRLITPGLLLAILIFNLWLCVPFFAKGDMQYRGSIEGGYGGTARFISAHPNPWGWNPLQYCGLPTQFTYLPLLPYITALLSHFRPKASPEHLYRAWSALFTCFGPVMVFLLVNYFTRSRKWALAAALAYTLVSPVYGMFGLIDRDRGVAQLPWRLQLLAKYGEGPHNAALAMIPLAILAAWKAGTGRRYWQILAAAVMMAAVTLTNWVAALALAVCCLLLMFAALDVREFRSWRVFAAATLAYLLACFWLTPTFVSTIAFNWPADAFGYKLETPQLLALGGLAIGLVVIRVMFYWRYGPTYFCYVTMCAFVFSYFAAGFYYFRLNTIPESRRYAMEVDLFVILTVLEMLRLLYEHRDVRVRKWTQALAALMLLTGSLQGVKFMIQPRWPWQPVPKETTLEYRLGDWIRKRNPQGRIFASGGFRFRLNAFFSLPQVGGGFETGLRNRNPIDFAYRIRTTKGLKHGREEQDTMTLLKTLGVEYVVVHGSDSEEYYRDFVEPERLRSMEMVYNAADDTIYQMPAPPLAHLIQKDELPLEDAANRTWVLEPYVRAMEDPARPKLRADWHSPAWLTVSGSVPEGQLVAVKVNWEEGWRAMESGRPIAIDRDEIGFMVLHPTPAADARIDLEYVGTQEPRVAAGVSACAWVLALAGVGFDVRRRKVS